MARTGRKQISDDPPPAQRPSLGDLYRQLIAPLLFGSESTQLATRDNGAVRLPADDADQQSPVMPSTTPPPVRQPEPKTDGATTLSISASAGRLETQQKQTLPVSQQQLDAPAQPAAAAATGKRPATSEQSAPTAAPAPKSPPPRREELAATERQRAAAAPRPSPQHSATAVTKPVAKPSPPPQQEQPQQLLAPSPERTGAFTSPQQRHSAAAAAVAAAPAAAAV